MEQGISAGHEMHDAERAHHYLDDMSPHSSQTSVPAFHDPRGRTPDRVARHGPLITAHEKHYQKEPPRPIQKSQSLAGTVSEKRY